MLNEKKNTRTWISRIVLAVALSSLLGYFCRTEAQIYQTPEFYIEQCECHICGKTIREQKEKQSLHYVDDMFLHNNYGFVADSLRIQHLTIDKEIFVCKDCLAKYSADIEMQINKLWDGLIAKYVEGNKANRQYYKEQRRQNTIKELNGKIKELEREKDGLQGKK